MMSMELHSASVSLEHALRKIMDRDRYEKGFDADNIDTNEGLRSALADGIYDLLDKIDELEKRIEILEYNQTTNIEKSKK